MKKSIFYFLLLVLVFSCSKETFEINNLSGGKIIALGHSGMGASSSFPMNSFESINNALLLGAAGCEIDIQMTQDSILVLYHSPNLQDRTNMEGVIHSKNWEEIQKASYIGAPFLKYAIVTLNDLFAQIPNLQDYTFAFDCKLYPKDSLHTDYYHTFANAIKTSIQKFGMQNNVYIESQDTRFLDILQEKKPNSPLLIYTSDFDTGLEIALKHEYEGITIASKNISKEQTQKAHANNILISIWNIHSNEDNEEAIRKNPDIIQSDNLKHLLDLLD
jgi:glycerophosphoryl diester phosphodiesterase